MTTTPAIQERAEPQLPPFLQHRRPVLGVLPATADRSYAVLLNRLRGELGFEHQRTALRWLLEQLEDCADLRALVLLLLDQREA